MNTHTPDFAEIHGRFTALPPGGKAELRRAAMPDDLRLTPALYRLFPGMRPTDQQLRLAFVLPWCEHVNTARKLAALCAGKIAEERIIQIARAHSPDDLIQFRRLVMQLRADVGWADIANTLWFWGRNAKRGLVEDFYISLHKLDKGEKQ
jgi:CRISPR system Cascade subunit CasB